MLSEYEPKVKGKHQIAIRDDDIIVLVVHIKNPRGREDEDEGESEGITGEKMRKGKDVWLESMASRSPSSSPRAAPPSPPLRELVVASPLVLASYLAPPSSRIRSEG